MANRPHRGYSPADFIGDEDMELTTNQKEILDHTAYRAVGNLYCGDSEDMQELVRLGLMESAGKKSFVPDEYFKITALGRKALKGHRPRNQKRRFDVEQDEQHRYQVEVDREAAALDVLVGLHSALVRGAVHGRPAYATEDVGENQN